MTNLERPIGLIQATAMVAGVLSVWMAAGVLTLFGSLVCAERGFLWGWAMFWIAHSGIIAASSVVLQTGVTAAKLAAIALLLIMALLFGHRASAPIGSAAAGTGFREFVLGVSAALFAFGGWHMVTYTAGETRDPRKTIPKALLIGVAIVTVCYLALNATYLYLLPLARVTASTRVAADAAFAVAGARGAAVISALVILSAVGVLNGVILAGPRTYFAMAEEGLAFAWLARIHPRYHTPYWAILLQAVWSCARGYGHLPCVVHAGGLYRVAVLRDDDSGAVAASPASGVQAGVPGVGLSICAGGVRRCGAAASATD